MNNYIIALCKPPKGYECKVKRFAAMPRIGESVQCGNITNLKISNIIHCDSTKDPYIIVELSLPYL